MLEALHKGACIHNHDDSYSQYDGGDVVLESDDNVANSSTVVYEDSQLQADSSTDEIIGMGRMHFIKRTTSHVNTCSVGCSFVLVSATVYAYPQTREQKDNNKEQTKQYKHCFMFLLLLLEQGHGAKSLARSQGNLRPTTLKAAMEQWICPVSVLHLQRRRAYPHLVIH